jgi:hypothetical protein
VVAGPSVAVSLSTLCSNCSVVRSHPVPAPRRVPHCSAVLCRADGWLAEHWLNTGRQQASESPSPHLTSQHASLRMSAFPAHLGAAPALKTCPPCLNSCRRCPAAPHDPLLPLSALAFPRLAQHMTCARSRLASPSNVPALLHRDTPAARLSASLRCRAAACHLSNLHLEQARRPLHAALDALTSRRHTYHLSSTTNSTINGTLAWSCCE